MSLFALCSIGLVGIQAFCAYNQANTIKEQIQAGDFAEVERTAQDLSSMCRAMDFTLDTPFWVLLRSIPEVGGDLDTVKQALSIASAAIDEAIRPLLSSLSSADLSQLINESGAIDIRIVEPVLKTLEEEAPSIQRYTDQVEELPEMNIAAANEPFSKAKRLVGRANDLLQRCVTILPAIEDMLDPDSTNTYLIAAQNVAETRSAGGFPGAIGVLSIDHGKIDMKDFSTPYQVFPEGLAKGVTITEEEYILYDPVRMNRTRDANFNPDFPRVASIWAAGYDEMQGTEVDGVVSVTPTIVQGLLSVTGPITLSDGTVLDSSNATKVLQHDLYWKYLSAATVSSENADLTDKLFAEAASLTFGKITANLNSQTIVPLAKTLIKALDDRTIMLWYENQNLENKVLEAGFGGGLSHDPQNPQLGVFFSLSIASKLGWYLDESTRITDTKQNNDGSTTYSMKTVLKNTLTEQEVTEGGYYIIGLGNYRPQGDVSAYVYLFAPVGSRIDNFKSNRDKYFKEGAYDGLNVTYAHHIPIMPGEALRCTYEITIPAGTTELLSIVSTPTLASYRE